MYVKNFRELIEYMIAVFKERRFWFSVKYIFWVLFDRIRGVDYIKNEGYDKVGTTENEASVFQATRDIKYLCKILDEINISSRDAILDLGSGKGYLLKIFAQKYPFNVVGGVELSSRLCNIAESNLRKEGIKNYKLYNINAMEFSDYDNYNYIYMFNPFPSCVMKSVMRNIEEHIKKFPQKKMCIIYRNALCNDDILASGIFYLKKRYPGKTSDYCVYCNF